jgi:hypothetical protein
VDDRVSIRARFERFPASVKGAFVMRGADGNPHQVRLDDARVREVAGRGGGSIGINPVTLDVAPNLDLFVPFEFGLTDLDAGWYGLECRIAIDGDPRTVRPGRRFAVPWPRATVRRGTVAVGRTVQIDGGSKVKIERLDLGGDSIKLQYVAPAAVDVRLSADGSHVAVLQSEFDAASGKGRIVAYPLLKSQSVLSVDVRGASVPIDLKLD